MADCSIRCMALRCFKSCRRSATGLGPINAPRASFSKKKSGTCYWLVCLSPIPSHLLSPWSWSYADLPFREIQLRRRPLKRRAWGHTQRRGERDSRQRRGERDSRQLVRRVRRARATFKAERGAGETVSRPSSPTLRSSWRGVATSLSIRIGS
jgi:hypothetical protein